MPYTNNDASIGIRASTKEIAERYKDRSGLSWDAFIKKLIRMYHKSLTHKMTNMSD